MTWRNLREELCEVLAETVEARVPLGPFHPNQSVHVERGGCTTFRGRSERATCRQCHLSFRRKRFGMRAIFCSRVCASRHWRRTHDTPILQELRAHRIAYRKCACGKPVRQPKRSTGRLTAYCCKKCGEHTRNARMPSRARPDRFVQRLCACGKPAKRPRPTGIVPKYCSSACAQRQLAHRQRCARCIFKGDQECCRATPRRKPWTEATMWRPGRPRLSAAQIDEARRMRASGAVYTAIAEHLGICPSHAHRITAPPCLNATPHNGHNQRASL